MSSIEWASISRNVALHASELHFTTVSLIEMENWYSDIAVWQESVHGLTGTLTQKLVGFLGQPSAHFLGEEEFSFWDQYCYSSQHEQHVFFICLSFANIPPLCPDSKAKDW